MKKLILILPLMFVFSIFTTDVKAEDVSTIKGANFDAVVAFDIAMNPCAKNACSKNPCGKNPCAKNACSKNPCMTNPCAKNACSKNPCMKNPCKKMPSKELRNKHFKNEKQAIKYGKKLWKSTKLSSNNLSCNSCHAGGDQLKLGTSFPHYVNMTKDVVTLDQMINFCILNPMAGKELKWNSRAMTGIASYYKYLEEKAMKKNK